MSDWDTKWCMHAWGQGGGGVYRAVQSNPISRALNCYICIDDPKSFPFGKRETLMGIGMGGKQRGHGCAGKSATGLH